MMSNNYLRGGLVALALTAAVTRTAMAQPGPHGHGHHRRGPAPQLILKSEETLILGQDGWRKHVNYDASTHFYRDGKAVTSDEIHEGESVRVRDEVLPDGRLLAVEVSVERPHPIHGRLVTKDENSFLVDSHHELVRVDVTEATRYWYGFIPSSPDGMKAGMGLEIEGHPTGPNRFQADRINAHFPWGALALGVILSGGVAVYVHKRRCRKAKPEPSSDVVAENPPHGVHD